MPIEHRHGIVPERTSQHQFEPWRAVVHHLGHRLAFADTQPVQAIGQAENSIPELTEGDPTITVDNRLTISPMLP